MEAAMKYMILIHSNPMSREMWESFSADQQAAGFAEYAALAEDLAASGELIVTEALADPSLTKRISLHEGRVMATDGPLAEVKEHLAGFFLVECESMERAVEIAGRVPEADLGLVQVRPVMDLSGFEM
jgi:hypothetical protein